MTTATGHDRESIREKLAHVLPVVEEHRGAGEADRRLPDPIVRALREAELFTLWAPREFGGHEVELPAFMAAVEEIARVDGATGWTFANLATGAVLAAHAPSDGAKELYAGGPNVTFPGSVIPRGRAIPVEGGYRLTGRWPLGSGCHHADWISSTALIFDGDAPRMGPDGAPDLHAMFVRPSEVEVLDTWHSLGLRGTGSTDFAVEDAFVPARRTFPLFTQQPQVAGPLYRLGILPLYSMSLTSVL